MGSTDADVPLSTSVRGEVGLAGLLRLWSGELEFDSVVAMSVEQEEGTEDEGGGDGADRGAEGADDNDDAPVRVESV